MAEPRPHADARVLRVEFRDSGAVTDSGQSHTGKMRQRLESSDASHRTSSGSDGASAQHEYETSDEHQRRDGGQHQKEQFLLGHTRR
jgi:hypothetical protein